MKVYIAGSWEDRDHIKKIIEEIESRGHLITEDWTKHEDPNLGHEYCMLDIQGIQECDVFIIYLSEKKSFGKAFEMGYAYGICGRKQIVAFGNKKYATSVFFRLKGIVFVDNVWKLTKYLHLYQQELKSGWE